MSAPATIGDFVKIIQRSGVVDAAEFDLYWQQLQASELPQAPRQLAERFVRDGVLTSFQANQFLLGKWKRFTIGKYKILDRLGSGGMGSVYLCEDKFMHRRVALKVLPPVNAQDSSALERFYREARAIAALDHPNIVRAFDVGQDDQLPYFVLEHVDGSTFKHIVSKHGPMDLTRAAHYISQAAVGVQHAHEKIGLVHRDLKPSNLLLDRQGIVKILDMGLALFFDEDEDDPLTRRFREKVLGTADYMAPEQAEDSHTVDIRADVYSLGATFYFLLTGTTAFEEGSVQQKLDWLQRKPPRPIQSLRQDLPDSLAAIIGRMMAKDPERRYQLPVEVVQALKPWTQQAILKPSASEMPEQLRASTF